MVYCKRKRFIHERSNLFDGLPDDIVISILCKLSATASAPSEFITTLLICKRFNRLSKHPLVLSMAGPKALAFPAKNWSEDAHRFLKICVAAGNTDASYFLGMIRFYCLENRRSGESLMAKAAIRSHAPALYSLALIQFNGSGRLKDGRDLRAGVELCARAAFLGHIDALREIGHCLQDGYGVRKDVTEGRRLLVQANASELAWLLPWSNCQTPEFSTDSGLKYGTWSDIGLKWPIRRSVHIHPANKFLVEWFGLEGRELGNGLRMCSYRSCGRPETRRNEFRRCSDCGKVNYCSRVCQAHDWRLHHKVECAPVDLIDGVEDLIFEVGDDPTVEVEDDVLIST